MIQREPPDNLPVEPLATERKRVSEIRWGRYALSEESLERFKEILRADISDPLPWTDEELRLMAFDTVRTMTLLVGLHVEEGHDKEEL